jgi:hypothetical protein
MKLNNITLSEKGFLRLVARKISGHKKLGYFTIYIITEVFVEYYSKNIDVRTHATRGVLTRLLALGSLVCIVGLQTLDQVKIQFKHCSELLSV